MFLEACYLKKKQFKVNGIQYKQQQNRSPCVSVCILFFLVVADDDDDENVA
jgi:hypothetical protein